ncbi:MAG: AAA family ATPase [Candidatus Paceibacterota bacterium]
MKLKSFQIKNYKSIQDTGEVKLDTGRIAIFAGQNESGKSAMLEALYAFEQGSFHEDSIPFDSDESNQEVSCTYQIEDSDKNFWEELENRLAEDMSITHEKKGDFLDIKKLSDSIKEITLIRSVERTEKPKVSLSMSDQLLQIINASVLEKAVETEIKKEDGTTEKKSEKQKLVELSTKNAEVADAFWSNTPKIVLFNDFCDLLPDKFSIADLKADKKDAKGYKAVKNFEKLAGVNFQKLYEMDDLKRDAVVEQHNEAISVDFTKAWKQQIHADNKVKIAYSYVTRDTEENSYVNFYIETKDKQKIRPRMRSKGLIWFLSFWMEIQASGNDNNLVILADEPGLYLHIRAQEDILGVFEDLAQQNHQVLYSTHSPNLITTEHLERISLVINDHKKGTIIEGVTTSKIDSKNKQDALQPVANAIGFSVNDFALPNSKNVLLEGVSDYFYYMGMRKLLNRKNDYSLVPGIGVRKQSTLISFCVGYGIDWVAVFDDDSTRGKDSQKTYADIKRYLFGEDDKLAESKMHITQDISSVENMFIINDMKLIDDKLANKADVASAIGEKRKVVFAKTFFEKVESGAITKNKLDNATIANFNKIFDWVEKNLNL